MFAAMIGGNASIIQAGAIAAVSANTAGGDVVIIGATGTVSSFRLMARPEIKSVSDLKGGPIEWTNLEPVVVQVDSLMLGARAPHPNTGRLFIDFLLSEEGQMLLQKLNRP